MRAKLVLSVLLALTVVAAAAPQADAAGARIRMVRIQYNSPGTDTGTNASINAEYVVLKNVGTARGNLNGYSIHDLAGHTRTLGTKYLSPGQYVYLRSGKGTNTYTSIYWGSGAYIWNNTGDKAYWKSPSGTLLQTCTWTSSGTGSKTCSY